MILPAVIGRQTGPDGARPAASSSASRRASPVVLPLCEVLLCEVLSPSAPSRRRRAPSIPG